MYLKMLSEFVAERSEVEVEDLAGGGEGAAAVIEDIALATDETACYFGVIIEIAA